MLKTTHYFNPEGEHLGSAIVGTLTLAEDTVEVKNYVQEYPYPIHLVEGSIVENKTIVASRKTTSGASAVLEMASYKDVNILESDTKS